MKIGWFSRNEVLPQQQLILDHIFNCSVQITQFKDMFQKADDLLKIARGSFKYAIIVAPLSMIQRVIEEKTIIWLWAEMKMVHNNCLGTECPHFNPASDVIIGGNYRNIQKEIRHQRFVEFKRIKSVNIELEPFSPS